MIEYTDETIMSYGMHKGKALANIPAKYLLYIYNNNMIYQDQLKIYIVKNMDALLREAGLKPKRS